MGEIEDRVGLVRGGVFRLFSGSPDRVCDPHHPDRNLQSFDRSLPGKSFFPRPAIFRLPQTDVFFSSLSGFGISGSNLKIRCFWNTPPFYLPTSRRIRSSPLFFDELIRFSPGTSRGGPGEKGLSHPGGADNQEIFVGPDLFASGQPDGGREQSSFRSLFAPTPAPCFPCAFRLRSLDLEGSARSNWPCGPAHRFPTGFRDYANALQTTLVQKMHRGHQRHPDRLNAGRIRTGRGMIPRSLGSRISGVLDDDRKHRIPSLPERLIR